MERRFLPDRSLLLRVAERLPADEADSEPPQRQAVSSTIEEEGAPPDAMSGRVVDAATGKEIEPAVLWRPDDPICWATTVGQGRFVLPAAPGSVGEVAVAARGFRRARILASAGGSGSGLLVRLTPASGAVGGKVVDPAGRPVEDALVRCRPGDAWTFSNEAGRFLLEGLEAGGTVQLEVEREGFALARAVARAHPVYEPREEVAIVLGRPRFLSGRVTDPSERPLDGVHVSVSPEPGERVDGVTDEKGRFAIGPLRAQDQVLRFELEGYATILHHVEVEPGDGPLVVGTIVLPPGASLHGTVRDPTGEPVAEARVFVRRSPAERRGGASGEPLGLGQATTAADGTFVLEGLEPGRSLDVEVWRRDFLPFRTQLLVSELENTLDVELERATQLVVEVMEEDGGPVAGATMTFKPEQPGHSDTGRGSYGRTGEDGRFVFEAVEPGRLRLSVMARGFALHERVVEVGKDEETVDVVVRLEREAAVWGTVVDEGGVPVLGARVSVVREQLPVLPFGQSQSTDRAGRYRLDMLQPGATRLRVEHRDFETAEVLARLHSGEQRQDFRLWSRPTHSVTGQVLEGGWSPVTGARVELQSRRTGHFYASTTDEGGSFHVADVPDGTYVVGLPGSLFYVASDSRLVTVDGADLHGLAVRAEKSCSVEGSLDGLAGIEARRAAVWAVSARRELRGRVEPVQETFRLEPLVGGIWELVGRVPGTDLQARQVVECKAGGGELRVDLYFTGGGSGAEEQPEG